MNERIGRRPEWMQKPTADRALFNTALERSADEREAPVKSVSRRRTDAGVRERRTK
ncbi:MAG TPA: hypothetical protein VGH81_06775 [Rudaea sp.]